MTLKTQSTSQLLVSPPLTDILHYLATDGVGEKKTYYSDKHECEQNIRDRGIFIQKYHKYERNAYLWVQISNERVPYLEQNDCGQV